MTERVKDATCFHVNRRDTHVPKPRMELGQTLMIGNTLNSLYGFIESKQRVYRTEVPGLGVKPVAPVYFMQLVATGQIPPPADFVRFAADIVSDFAILVRELVFEDVRAREFPYAPSRKTCLWLCDTEEDAVAWANTLGRGRDLYRILEVNATGRVHTAETRHLENDLIPVPRVQSAAKLYWRGDIAPENTRETLFVGKLEVARIVADHWPDA
ncbi:MAG: DUF2441 domain-containing protein [Alphaproteobacteria bacterium]|nr:DUF2441 domain-containing protein [Alphaproteobacteria bacterium]